jgi:hypothetical protein
MSVACRQNLAGRRPVVGGGVAEEHADRLADRIAGSGEGGSSEGLSAVEGISGRDGHRQAGALVTGGVRAVGEEGDVRGGAGVVKQRRRRKGGVLPLVPPEVVERRRHNGKAMGGKIAAVDTVWTSSAQCGCRCSDNEADERDPRGFTIF